MQLTRNIHILNLPFVVPLPTGPIERSVNVVLLSTDTVTMIDSGTAGADARIFEYLRTIGHKPEDIRLLLLTHSHPDHIGAAQAIVSATGCQVAAHSTERNWIEDVALQGRERPVPGFDGLVGGSVPITRLLNHGEIIDVGGGISLEVLHTPGHSRGSLSFWCVQEQALITGDAIPIPNEMPIFDSFAQSVESLQSMKANDAQLLLSAWERPLRGDEIPERFSTSINWLERVHDAVRSVAGASEEIAQPMDLCARVVAALDLPPFAVNPLVARSFLACAYNR